MIQIWQVNPPTTRSQKVYRPHHLRRRPRRPWRPRTHLMAVQVTLHKKFHQPYPYKFHHKMPKVMFPEKEFLCNQYLPKMPYRQSLPKNHRWRKFRSNLRLHNRREKCRRQVPTQAGQTLGQTKCAQMGQCVRRWSRPCYAAETCWTRDYDMVR